MNRLYNDLAWLWPLWGDPSEYQSYCREMTEQIRTYAQREVKTLLNLGCGGGKNAMNLKGNFRVTGLDISPDMLNHARLLNPECTFVQGDMRNFDLGEMFDAILVDDAISYMTSPEDLQAVFDSCFDHLSPGGIMVVGPDETKETFVQNASHTTPSVILEDSRDVEVTFIENNYDPDPSDTEYEALMVYLIRRQGKLEIEKDMHLLGLFSLDQWRKVLDETGFQYTEVPYVEEGKEYTQFICLKSL